MDPAKELDDHIREIYPDMVRIVTPDGPIHLGPAPGMEDRVDELLAGIDNPSPVKRPLSEAINKFATTIPERGWRPPETEAQLRARERQERERREWNIRRNPFHTRSERSPYKIDTNAGWKPQTVIGMEIVECLRDIVLELRSINQKLGDRDANNDQRPEEGTLPEV